jgi:ATP-dependent RNA helicase SUPV3L1/SUV3
MNAKGKPCALVTGEEQRMPDAPTVDMWSCTVEMAPLNQRLEVAVIDEIQMISHKERGWAWTQAFLGIQAQEIHLCGEARAVPLMKELSALVGDEVVVHEYQRLTPLKAANRSLGGDLTKNLQKGDCIVSFSVLGIHALRKVIEKSTGRKCAIVYGSLPPETRAQQARLFNDPDNDYDFLVASDAIGMGLNL